MIPLLMCNIVMGPFPNGNPSPSSNIQFDVDKFYSELLVLDDDDTTTSLLPYFFKWDIANIINVTDFLSWSYHQLESHPSWALILASPLINMSLHC
jgi:hypothetical protein